MFQSSSVLCRAFLFFDIDAGGLQAMPIAAAAFVVRDGLEMGKRSSFAGGSQAGIYMTARCKVVVYSIVEWAGRLSRSGDSL